MKFGQKVCEERRWFAWRPVRLIDGSWVMFEYTYRLKDAFWGKCYYEYRLKPKHHV